MEDQMVGREQGLGDYSPQLGPCLARVPAEAMFLVRDCNCWAAPNPTSQLRLGSLVLHPTRTSATRPFVKYCGSAICSLSKLD